MLAKDQEGRSPEPPRQVQGARLVAEGGRASEYKFLSEALSIAGEKTGNELLSVAKLRLLRLLQKNTSQGILKRSSSRNSHTQHVSRQRKNQPGQTGWGGRG